MTVSRGRRSRESRRSPSEKIKDSGRISISQKKFLRKLLHVLADIVDERGDFKDVDERGFEAGSEAVAIEDTDSKYEAEGKKDTKETGAHGRLSRPAHGQGTKENEKMEVGNEVKIVTHLIKLCDDHSQLTFQIRSALNALGGGGRTARALEVMHDKITEIKNSFFGLDKTFYLDPSDCVRALNASREAASEVMKAFKELGVFNTAFFDKLDRIERQLETTAVKLDVEYGSLRYLSCCVDDYLDYVFEPLALDFKDFLQELTNIAEKEIATIRQTQEFSSQRYLNLTTVATFLSSVTATTLQITASGSVSNLATVTNTLWFISLVFSTASAVYSLLVMTWRQSSVRQPDLSLSSLANAWLRNGPMYALITAVMTFSIGLCLLAFQIADQQGGLASAAVPTAFAGLHAYAIFLFSAWFLLEQWKARHSESWVKARDGYLIPFAGTAKAKADKIGTYGSRVKHRLLELHVAFIFKRRWSSSSTNTNETTNFDVELGQNAAIDPPTAVASETPAQLPSEQTNEAYHTPEAAEPGNTLAVLEATPTPPENNPSPEESANKFEEVPEAKYKPFEPLLQFSPNGDLLASGFSDTVTIYDVNNSFVVICTIKVPDGDPVKQITWNPNSHYLPLELLVRSSKRVTVWNVDMMNNPNEHLSAQLNEIVAFVRWVTTEDAGVEGFSCAINTTVKVFDSNCKEIRTYDLSGVCAVNRIVDIAFFHKKYVLCLEDITGGGGRETRLLVFNTDNNSVERKLSLFPGQTSLNISQVSGMILFHGSELGVELLISSDRSLNIADQYSLWDRTNWDEELAKPEEAVIIHGKDDKMIIGYSAGEVVALCRLPDSFLYSALHIFTTPTAEAVAQNPTSFAVRRSFNLVPYTIAFGDEEGSVKIWSVQSDKLSKSDSAENFVVHDRRSGRSGDPSASMGRFLTLPPPVIT